MKDPQRFNPDDLNTSELAAGAAMLHPEAHRGLPRSVLIAIVKGEEVDLPQRMLNRKRLRIMEHINKRWNAVQWQVTCPAKSQDPFACYECTDIQVALCTLENRKLFAKEEEAPGEKP